MAGKPLISEATVLDAHREGKTTLAIPPDALITPLARDTARMKGITFVPQEEASSEEGCSCGCKRPRTHTIALGCDHGGFAYKADLAKHINALGWQILDVGTHSDASCDYPDFAYAVALAVREGKADFGVMIDGAGLGSAMVCNKVPGIRAACAYNAFTAWNARAHNSANVLTLGSRTLGIEVCKHIVKTFLETDFEGGRHAGRVGKINDVEQRFSAPEQK